MKKNSSRQPESQKESLAASIRLTLEGHLLFDGVALLTANDAIQESLAQKTSSNVGTAAPYTNSHFESLGLNSDPNPLSEALTKPLATQEISQAKASDHSRSNTLTVVDPRSGEGGALLANPPEECRVLALDSLQNGFQQVAIALREGGKIKNLHLVPWIVAGKQWLGNSQLDETTNDKTGNMLAEWSDGLADDAHIVFHGEPSGNQGHFLSYVNVMTGAKSSWMRDVALLDINDATEPTASTNSVVFIDASIPNLDTLLDAVPATAEIVYLNNDHDGLSQIAQYLVGQSGIENIRLITHGREGELHLGSSVLNTDSLLLDEVKSQLAQIGQSLTANGDILVDGCEIAQTAKGQQFVSALAELTGADLDINNKSGSPDIGYQTNYIENAAPVAIGDTADLNIVQEDAVPVAGLIGVIDHTSNDAKADMSSTTLTVTNNNLAPIDQDDSNVVTEDTVLNVSTIDGLMASAGDANGVDSDSDDDALTVLAATMDTNGDGKPDPLVLGLATPITNQLGIPIGEITVNRNGNMNFEPAPNYNGPVPVLTYIVVDPSGATDTGTLDFSRVLPVNDAPIATDAFAMVTEETPVLQNLMDYATDPDGDALTVLAATMDTNGDGKPDPLVLGLATPITNQLGIPIGEITVNRNGNMNFEPAPNYNGPIPVLTYTVVDPSGATDTGTLAFDGAPLPIPYATASPTDIRSDHAAVSVELQQETGSLLNVSKQRQDKAPQVDPYSGFAPNGLPPNYVPLWENGWLKPVHLSMRDDLHLIGVLKNQRVVEKKPFSFGIPNGTFKHDNPAEKLEYRASRVDGSPLPNWLKFNYKTLVFYGVPPKGALSVEVLVTVNDSVGKEVSAAFKVAIHRYRLRTVNKPAAMALNHGKVGSHKNSFEQ